MAKKIKKSRNKPMFENILDLYRGTSPNSVPFNVVLICFDIVTLAFFITISFIPHNPLIISLEIAIGSLLVIDFFFQIAAAKNKIKEFFHPLSIIDLIVIVSLFSAPLTGNLVFLRIIRAIRIIRTYRLLLRFRSSSKFFKRNEEVIFSAFNLLAFIFIVSACVYVFQVNTNPNIKNYVDAIYFTVTTLTTTGFGDITLIGTSGRILSVLIMIFGITLFLKLAQTIFRPRKVFFRCNECGLEHHDYDAVHCKHCGIVLNITSDGY